MYKNKSITSKRLWWNQIKLQYFSLDYFLLPLCLQRIRRLGARVGRIWYLITRCYEIKFQCQKPKHRISLSSQPLEIQCPQTPIRPPAPPPLSYCYLIFFIFPIWPILVQWCIFYSMKTEEKFWSSDVFRANRNAAMCQNRLWIGQLNSSLYIIIMLECWSKWFCFTLHELC